MLVVTPTVALNACALIATLNEALGPNLGLSLDTLVKQGVLSLRKHLQVLRSIVRSYVIDVMNAFVASQVSSKPALCDQNVLEYIAILVGLRVVFPGHVDVSEVNHSSAAPGRMALAVDCCGIVTMNKSVGFFSDWVPTTALTQLLAHV